MNSDREKRLAYTTQYEWVVMAFKLVGIISQMKTHIGRAAGAKLAELLGVAQDQIRRAGRWNYEQIVGYLNSLPREFMRRMAAQMDCFEIKRASATPPDELLSLIWPELDNGKAVLGPSPIGMGFTDHLFQLREVMLQDSVALRRLFPENAIQMYPVFQHPSYHSFARQMEPYLDEDLSLNRLTLIHQVMYELVGYLQALLKH